MLIAEANLPSSRLLQQAGGGGRREGANRAETRILIAAIHPPCPSPSIIRLGFFPENIYMDRMSIAIASLRVPTRRDTSGFS